MKFFCWRFMKYRLCTDRMYPEYFVVEKLATMLAFRLVNPKEDKPVFVTLAICSMIVCLMCPVMSLIATVLFVHPGNQVIAVWLQKFALNFPMALCWQIFLEEYL